MQTLMFKSEKKASRTMTESLRSLRTNLTFCGDDVKTIMITSSVPNEGKSTVSYELARSLTESNKRVLIIDTDMRKSVLAGRLGARTYDKQDIKGLSHYLSGQCPMGEALYNIDTNPNLYMLFAGPSVPNPTELLEKQYFQDLITYAKTQFDYVIIDCAPIGAAIDAAVVAKYCDGAILVVAQGMVSSRMVASVKKQLEVSGVRILGAVLNKVVMKERRYGGYYGKYYNKYYGGYYGSYYGSYYGDADDAESDNASKKNE